MNNILPGNNNNNNSDDAVITIKVKTEHESDFIEMEIDRSNMSFDEFKIACVAELDDILDKTLPVVKIRKLPNILIRNTRDIKRLKNNQEIEFIFEK